jgi:hypothetical protein
MTVKLKKEELGLRLTHIDAQLLERGTPLKHRPLEAFKAIYGTISDGELHNSFFEPVVAWFIEKYGESAKWDGVIGRGPIIIRGHVYLIAFPFTSGDACLRLTDHIENLPQNIRETFTAEEFKDVGRKAAGAMLFFGNLYDLTVQDTFLDDVEKGLVWRGLADLETAASSLKHNQDVQTAIFHTHESAEKFLKVAIKRSGFTADLKSLKHNLQKIFEKLIALNSRYSWLRSPVNSLQNFAPNMEIRYGFVPRTVENAISAFNSALSLSAALARMWLFDTVRGTDKAAFVPGSFYKDGIGNTYCCQALSLTTEKRPGALLRRFGNYLSGALMMDVLLDLNQSSLYLEIKDAQQVEALRRLYQLHLQNRGVERKPEDLGIQITSGPEGSYTTGFIQTKVTEKD